MNVPFLTAFHYHMAILPCFVAIQLSCMGFVYVFRMIHGSGEFGSRKTDTIGQTLYDWFIKDILLFCFLTYPGLTVRIFRVLRCRSFKPSPIQYLVADMNIVCGSEEHNNAVGLAILFIFLYVLGIPLWLYQRLWRYRHVIEEINDDNDAKLTQMVNLAMEQAYR